MSDRDKSKADLVQEIQTVRGRLAELESTESQRKKQEDELGRFRLMVESAGDSIFFKDSDGRYVTANRTTLEVFGLAAEEVVGKTDFDLMLRKEEARTSVADDQVVFKTGKPMETARHVTGADGKEHWFQTIKVPHFDANGRVDGLVGVARDITARTQLETQLLHSQKMGAIGRLAGGMAHDFNNILTGIIGYTRLVLQNIPDDEQVRADLGRIGELGERAARLTRQLLAFTRRQPLAPTVLNVNELVENISDMLRRIIGEDIELEFVPARDLRNVRADPGQIEQVLMNLVVNARDAMQEGGKLSIETANAAVDEQYAKTHTGLKPGRYVVVSVTDNGRGMDKATLEHMFEPYFTTKEPGKGTGLGLSTAYGIVEQHGGCFWVQSKPGKGTTFKVYLPRIDAAAQPLPAKAAEGVSPEGSETVLVVEDEDSVRDMMQRVLKQQGYEVLAGATAHEAEQAFGQHGGKVSLLMTDVVMPGRSGMELYERLVAYRPSLKVLYVSGYSESTFVLPELLGPHAGFLQKPFTPDVLLRKLREVLDKEGNKACEAPRCGSEPAPQAKPPGSG